MQSHSSCSGQSGAEAGSSVYYSTRSEWLSELQSKCKTDLEYNVESLKPHWTEVSAASANSDDSDEHVTNSVVSTNVDDSDDEQVAIRNRVVFEEMKKHKEWRLLCMNPYELKIGDQIGEGGQAEIFEAMGWSEHDKIRCANNKEASLVLKVFKKGFALEDLQWMWPPGIVMVALSHRYLGRKPSGFNASYLCWALGVHLLDDGRFGFIFDRHWGDLRKLIDERMLKWKGYPPFNASTTFRYMSSVARGMCNLHLLGIVHNDLKAANVLVSSGGSQWVLVADFESSSKIEGTKFWRAPEVLLAKKNGNLTQEIFTEKTDVYSFAMTCYEIITGQIPFEGRKENDYDIGPTERPTFPDDFPPSALKSLVTRCSDQDPQKRPLFVEIVANVKVASTSLKNEFNYMRNKVLSRRGLVDDNAMKY